MTVDKRLIEKYYEESQIWYNLCWSKWGLHYGFWDKNTKSFDESVLNSIKFMCEKIEIKSNDTVLDAGCGIGGTTRYIAKHYGAKVTGITISKSQIEVAKKKAKEDSIDSKTSFLYGDYLDTQFKNNSFTKVFGIESICYAKNKKDFIKEAFRVLKPDGMVGMADAFLVKTPAISKEKKAYDGFLKGWILPNLAYKNELFNHFKEIGFKDVRFYDKFGEVQHSSKRAYLIGIIMYPIMWLLSKLFNYHGIPETLFGHSVSLINQRKIVKMGLVTYGVFIAKK